MFFSLLIYTVISIILSCFLIQMCKWIYASFGFFDYFVVIVLVLIFVPLSKDKIQEITKWLYEEELLSGGMSFNSVQDPLLVSDFYIDTEKELVVVNAKNPNGTFQSMNLPRNKVLFVCEDRSREWSLVSGQFVKTVDYISDGYLLYTCHFAPSH